MSGDAEAGDFAIGLARPDEYEGVGELTVTANVTDDLVGESYVPELRRAADRAAAGELIVARDASGGELLGTVSLFRWDAGPRWAEGASPGDAVMRMLAVSPGARRRGIGRALTLECVRRAREGGCRRLLLNTTPQMVAAQQLYDDLGFHRDPAGDSEPIPGVHLLAYWLPLDGR